MWIGQQHHQQDTGLHAGEVSGKDSPYFFQVLTTPSTIDGCDPPCWAARGHNNWNAVIDGPAHTIYDHSVSISASKGLKNNSSRFALDGCIDITSIYP